MIDARRLRILHIIGSVDPNSGGPIEGILRQEEATRDISQREIASLDPPDAPFLADFPIKTYPLGAPRRGGMWARVERYGYSAKFAPWLRAHADDYDVVIVHGLWNFATEGAVRALRSVTVPYFVFTHGMMDPWFRRHYPLKHLAKQLFWLMFEGPLVAGARSVLFTCEEERRQARGVFRGYGDYAETVVGYGAGEPPPPSDAQVQAFRTAVPGLGGRRFLLFLSRIHPKKGCDLLIEAFANAAQLDPELHLVIAGPDETAWRATLEARATEGGVGERVHFPGGLFGDAKWGALRSAEAFILPSHQENFGIAVAEALACGRPVLISDKVNIWREIDGAGAGFVAGDDAAGTEILLRRWINLEVDGRQAMAQAAARLFNDQFNVRHTAPALVATLRRLKAGQETR